MTEEQKSRTSPSGHGEENRANRVSRDEIVISAGATVLIFAAGSLAGGSALFGIIPTVVVASGGMVMCHLNPKRRTLRRILLTVNSILALVGLMLTTYYFQDRVRHAKAQLSSPSVLQEPTKGQYYRLRSLDTRYYLLAPPSGQEGGPYPVVVLLHGNGGSGPEIMSDTQWDKIAPERGWLLIAPKSPEFTWESDADKVVIASLNSAATRYRIDPDRILLTGRSDGGTQCYRIGLRYPEVFRAIAPTAAARWPLAALHAVSSRHVQAYVYHATDDGTFDVRGARSSARLLRMTGHQVHYQESATGGHDYPPSQAQAVAEWFAGLE